MINYFIYIIILLLLSAIISASEIAFFSLNKKQLEKEKKKDLTKANIVINIINNRKKLLAALIISHNFLNIGIVIFSSYLINKYFTFPDINIYIFKYKIFFSLKFLFEVVGITFILLLFVEIIPKIYASLDNFKLAVFMSKPIHIIMILLNPLIYIMMIISNYIEKWIGKKQNKLSLYQLSQALKITINKKYDKDILFLRKIVHFGNIETRQIMTPRIDIFALNYNTYYADVLKIIISEGYSRVPVYKENIDNIVGILFVKDLLPFINEINYNWNQLIHLPFFIPENKKLDDLLKDFKDKKIHLAIVVDEYGGTCGLVTFEDVIEEIIGDIKDEYDEENISYFKEEYNNKYIFDGKISLIDFYRFMQIKEEEEDIFEKYKGNADTLGGFVMQLNKKFPIIKQQINFFNYTFIIKEVDKKRIKSIEVIRKT
ncbi:MAG: gliding motility-associated protein GldE [Candidatus Bostrichicola ureolyticus]|nr:MAG: gliding motility-associated protein GldE [Candidatus Bostrichicola ureolyticus]